jgi:hypothetical protein
MAPTHQHIYVSQDIILRELDADRRPQYADSIGRMRWGDPYRSFVGSVDGFEFKGTGYGASYAPLLRVARSWRGRRGAVASTPRLPRVRRHVGAMERPYDAHVYTLVGIRSDAVLVNDPLRGQYNIVVA